MSPRLRTSVRLLSAVVLCASALTVLGCGGYALVGRAQNLPDDVRRIYVQPLENRTDRSQLDQFLTGALVDELLRRPRFTVVSSAGEADAELVGLVNNFSVVPVSFDAEGRATDYELLIQANIAFRRTDPEQTVLWQNDQYFFRQNYQLNVTALGYFDQEDPAIREVAGRFAETVITDLLEGF
jgi:outer membrane lipopolysaccharide assembly protein LptE/RlpB